jgi:hypothetical protein
MRINTTRKNIPPSAETPLASYIFMLSPAAIRLHWQLTAQAGVSMS